MPNVILGTSYTLLNKTHTIYVLMSLVAYGICRKINRPSQRNVINEDIGKRVVEMVNHAWAQSQQGSEYGSGLSQEKVEESSVCNNEWK